MKKTLLFGGSGFLGNIFLRENPDMISVGRTHPGEHITNRHIELNSMDELSVLDDVEFDNVIFLIGNSNHHLLNNDGMLGFEYNVLPLKKVLHYMQHRNLNKFVCFSTILLYGNDPKNRPVNEKDDLYPYQNEYIFSKHMAEEVVKFYENRVPIINVRLCNIYGDTALVRPDLVPTLVKDILTTDNPTIWNDKPRRDFIFTSDAAEAIMLLMDTKYTGDINIGSGSTTSVSNVVSILEELSGKKVAVEGRPVSGVMEFIADISLLQGLTGWTAKHTLREGLEKTYNTMKNDLDK